MEQDQKEKYIRAFAGAIALVDGPRDEDYNRGGIGLRDYWKVNGIMAPLQMVDMKLKRALSQIRTWDKINKIVTPTTKTQVEKLTESMLDLINYAAFTICEAESLMEENFPKNHLGFYMQDADNQTNVKMLGTHLEEAIRLWKNHMRGKNAENN